MTDQNEQQRQLAIRMVESTFPADREALRLWAGSLIELRASNLPAHQKAKQAILITYRAKVVWPMLKVASKQIKKHGWDNRSASQRMGLGAAGTAMALFGGANAGIAALGGAIGVPLWVVLGAGAMFARHLYEELGGKKPGDPKVTYRVLDGEPDQD